MEAVLGLQKNRVEEVTGPPASAAFDGEGKPTRAAKGFAKKQGLSVEDLEVVETEKGRYVGFRREVSGQSLEAILAESLPRAVETMSFPKTMRWADGRFRWVRPVHWIVALHGKRRLALELFGVASGHASRGHRFLSTGPVEIATVNAYEKSLLAANVVADPGERRRRLQERLETAASSVGGKVVEDPQLLEEVVDLVEWPGVVVGEFDPSFLELPREILVTTLRHHQKSFSVHTKDGLLPNFLAVANTDRDPGGHVRRGNEWVVSGRLEDARFFWKEDRRRPLSGGVDRLATMLFHERAGTFADKAARLESLAARLG
ncbi:MAG: glycine--tRNA ligase subunit beta, partial [Acidobacteriota bacterium]|nr:glycine--tRNA ligase subunit beta [Acidobacteriota bacterium]